MTHFETFPSPGPSVITVQGFMEGPLDSAVGGRMLHSQMCRGKWRSYLCDCLKLYEITASLLHFSGSQAAVPQKTWPDITLELGVKLQKFSRVFTGTCERQNKQALTRHRSWRLKNGNKRKQQKQIKQIRTKEKNQRDTCFNVTGSL